MTYAAQPPVGAAPLPTPAATPRRPASVGIASALLIVMAVVGLAYAVATLATAPGTVDRFRDTAGNSEDVDGFVTVLWIGAAMSAVLAVILFALYIVLAMGLRRGSNGFRIATLVVCALGLVAGCASTVTVALQRDGDSSPGSLGQALVEAYPDSWIALNVGLGIAQMIGYVLVGVLLLAAPREFFGRAPKPAPADPFAAPAGVPVGYGTVQGGYPPPPTYGAPYPGGPPPYVGGPASHPTGPAPFSAGPAPFSAGPASHPAGPAPYAGGPAPATPAPVAGEPDGPSPWAAPPPTTPTAPMPSSTAAHPPSTVPSAPHDLPPGGVAPSEGAEGSGQWRDSPSPDQSTGAAAPGSTVNNPGESSPDPRSS
ncbi:hypothetical protein [Couchioplanes caeruleus]|uniref:Uncharacterized protein n=2 Tax=Couchioplanes caeruleus TaxID=56438 RepID=A0A1K0G3C8_9ACTN|nr:hypothetical protein [Couchioplanes caeruleus]OJF11786.1 hypothetical protein BG844_24330 [Couchioplanes caeruleus subsp. caeruleus]ROP31011.1 hypothetical protein EDD30_3896 [Couchioplanes caeruleus]